MVFLINHLTPNPYCTESLLCAEGLSRVAAERNERIFPKITARLVFKIKSSFFSPFLVNGYILSCKCQKCKKIILSYIYKSSYGIAKMKFFIKFTYITAAVRQTAKDTELNYFLSYSTQNANIFVYLTLQNDYNKLEKILLQYAAGTNTASLQGDALRAEGACAHQWKSIGTWQPF